MTTILQCPVTGWQTHASARRFRSPSGEPLDVVHDTPPVSKALFNDRLAQDPWGSGVWRYKELIHPALPPEHVVSRPEGNTPLLRSPAVAAFCGAGDLRLKHEGMNPTGSFKDRGMTVAVSQAVHVGAKAVICASTGNTSAAVAAYAALCGLPAVILVPEGKITLGKLGQALAYGARTVILRGDFDQAMQLVERSAEELGFYVLNSLNPFRIQGQKTIMFEALQQLGWRSPDWVAFPAGNLGNCSAFGMALTEAHQLGLIHKVPRLLAVQAAGAAPFAAAFASGLQEITPVRAETVATAIRIGDPVSYHRARRSIQQTAGVVTSVSDAEILAAKAVVDAAGVGAEPASCATVAGVKQQLERGLIAPTDQVVGVLTGHVLKDPGTIIAYHRGELGGSRTNPPVTIDPTPQALAEVVNTAENRG